MKNSRMNLTTIIFTMLMIFFVFYSLFPFYWMFITSLKTPVSVRFAAFLPYVDFTPDFQTWVEVLGFESKLYPGHGAEVRRSLVNGLLIGGISASSCVLLGALSGYALSRFRFKRWQNEGIALFILSQRMMPPAVVVLPLFLMFMNFRMLDTHLALIIVHTAMNLPFAVWILRDFFAELPIEIEEAALVDGASRLQVFFRISLPLVLPGFAVAWIVCFIYSWNDFITLLSLSYSETFTMPWVLAIAQSLRGKASPWIVCADGILAVIPPMVLLIIIQKYVVRGLTFGAVKD